MIEAVTDSPSCSPDGVPVTSIVTGYDAEPDDVDASTDTEPTVPKIGPDEPSVVSCTWSPRLISPTSVSSTPADTVHFFNPTTTKSAVDDPDDVLDALEEFALAPLRPLPEFPLPDGDEPPEPDEPEASWPVVTFTAATVPAIGERSVAPSSAVCAAVTDACAVATPA